MSICYCINGGPGSHTYLPERCYKLTVPDDAGHRLPMTKFDTGSTRNTEPLEDYEGFLSPLVLQAYARYMAKNRTQKDGNIRNADNWQKGIPKSRYMRSLWRHFHEAWMAWRHHRDATDMVDPLCAMLFNVQGMLMEVLIDLEAADRPYIRSEDVSQQQ